MSESESNICEQCGGVKRIEYIIGFENGMPRDMRVEPQDLPQTAWRLCPGHPEPATKHDGNLGDGGYYVTHDIGRSNGEFHYVRIQGKYNLGDDELSLTPKQALSLRDWLMQESAELERLAKEQEG